MSCQMQCLILIRIIGLLKNSYIICAAFVKICVLIRIHRIHFKTYHLEIFPGNTFGDDHLAGHGKASGLISFHQLEIEQAEETGILSYLMLWRV